MTSAGPILVAYASRFGSTAEVARFISQVFIDAGLPTELKSVADDIDVTAYRAVVLGTPIRMEKPMLDMLKFARAKRGDLRGRRCYIFSLGAWMRIDSTEHRSRTTEFLRPLIDITGEPAGLEMFGGKLDYDSLSFVWRMIARRDRSGLMKEGDGRQWDGILSWAKSVAAEIGQA